MMEVEWPDPLQILPDLVTKSGHSELKGEEDDLGEEEEEIDDEEEETFDDDHEEPEDEVNTECGQI